MRRELAPDGTLASGLIFITVALFAAVIQTLSSWLQKTNGDSAVVRPPPPIISRTR